MRSEGNTGALYGRALPIPTKPTGYAKRTPVRTGHKPIKCGTARGYERHRELGGIPCKDCLAAVKAKPLVQRKGPKPITHGTVNGYYAHRRRQEKSCQPCLDALSAYQRTERALKSEGRSLSRQRGPRFDLVKAQTMRDTGMSVPAIAREIGVSIASLYRWTKAAA